MKRIVLVLLALGWCGSALASSSVGPTLPSTCTSSPQDSFTLISPPYGTYYCSAANQWTGANFGAGVGAPTYVVLSGDVTNATTSYANITGLSWNVSASTRYDVECKLVYSANATTTGIGVSWTGPASPTLTAALAVGSTTAQAVGGTVIGGNDTGSTTTDSAATSGNVVSFRGFWGNGINAGTLQMRFKSEVAVSLAITVKAGSWCKYNTY